MKNSDETIALIVEKTDGYDMEKIISKKENFTLVEILTDNIQRLFVWNENLKPVVRRGEK